MQFPWADNEDVAVNLIWATENGTITADGVLTTVEEGEFLATVSLIGKNRGDTHIIIGDSSDIPQCVKMMPKETVIHLDQSAFFEVFGVDAQGNEQPLTPSYQADGGQMESK